MLQRLSAYRSRARQARRPHSHARRHHAAALRALTGAKLRLGLPVVPRTLHEAATLVASSPSYIEAATVLLQSDDQTLIKQVLRGNVCLLEAAARVKPRVRLVKAYREATPGDLRAFVDTIGVDRLFDEAIAPTLA